LTAERWADLEKLFGKPPSGMAWDAYVSIIAAGRSYDKILFLPPETPDSIVTAYGNAADMMAMNTTNLMTINLVEISEVISRIWSGC
jgi:hypothetical protein